VQRGGDALRQQQFQVLPAMHVVVHVGQARKQPGAAAPVHDPRVPRHIDRLAHRHDPAVPHQDRLVVQRAFPVHRQDVHVDEGGGVLRRHRARLGACRTDGREGQAGHEAGSDEAAGSRGQRGFLG
jgi:hypothetical protein